MAWFKRRAETKQPPPVREGLFQAVHFPRELVENSPAAPTMTPIKELADNDNQLALQKAIGELDVMMRIGAPIWLSFPPITSAKIATLSLLMHDHEPLVASTAANALWQLLMTAAAPDQVALLERIASPTDTHADYDVARGLVSDLMTSALGRNLKAGEMENVTGLLRMQLRVSPA